MSTRWATNIGISVPSSDGYWICVTLSCGNSVASGTAPHDRTPSAAVKRCTSIGAPNVPRARNALPSAASSATTLATPRSRRSPPGQRSTTSIPTWLATTNSSSAQLMCAPSTTSGRSATTVVHVVGSVNAARITRPFGASSVVTPTSSSPTTRNDVCACCPATTTVHSPDATSNMWTSMRVQPAITCTSTYRPSSLMLTSGQLSGVGRRSNTTGSTAAGAPSMGAVSEW
ncbi:unannotated protein [freshwater metagenome]|uniref:Unannotated protein n=1 Tax=freshwater metagenome TaxID=449393 RepID=A0A6J7PMY2_9ZZZZ